MESLIQLDHSIFKFINQTCSNSFLDTVAPIITDLHVYYLTYVALAAIFGVWIYKRRKLALICILQIIIALALADSIAYRVIKNNVQRARPEFVLEHVELRTHSHSGFSFPSNHAANMFAAATVLTFEAPPLAPVFFSIASIIALSRVYVGVHFPLDVFGGAVLGILCALLVTFIFRRIKL